MNAANEFTAFGEGKGDENLDLFAETPTAAELLLTTTAEKQKGEDEKGFAHWKAAADILSQIAFRLASKSSTS